MYVGTLPLSFVRSLFGLSPLVPGTTYQRLRQICSIECQLPLHNHDIESNAAQLTPDEVPFLDPTLPPALSDQCDDEISMFIRFSCEPSLTDRISSMLLQSYRVRVEDAVPQVSVRELVRRWLLK